MNGTHASRAAHRDDIDGLRAVAVIPVILFHYGMINVAPGGFVGVDIFFVISGYLITGILHRELQAGTYSLLGFYERRIRRIFPALFVMFAFCLVCAFFVNFPSEIREFGHSILAATLFVSNVLFYASSGYFDQKMQLNPVLHTWSLSVEEQFYILFPLLLFAMRRFATVTTTWVLTFVIVVSLACAAWTVTRNPSAAFYLVQFRAWELLLGAVLALGAIPRLTRAPLAELLGAAGLVSILASCVWMSKSTPFPGIAAMAPCLGAAAIIYSGSVVHTRVRGLLSTAVFRFIGKISYSLYLWHWPLYVFLKFGDQSSVGAQPGRTIKLVLIAVCFLLATLSWRFVERPFRERRSTVPSRRVVQTAGGVMALTAVLALLAAPTSAVFWRYSARTDRILAFTDYDTSKLMRIGTCFLTSGAADFGMFKQDPCLTLKRDHKNILLIGDSHAAHLWPGLNAVYPDVNWLQANSSGCKPTFPASGERRCAALMNYMFQTFLPQHHVDVIVLAGRWVADDVDKVKVTTELLRHYADRIIVMGPIVEYEQALPRLLARGILNGDEAAFAAAYINPAQAKTDQLFAAAFGSYERSYENSAVSYFSVYHALCAATCVVWVGTDVPIQFDGGHLTREGSIYVAERMRAVMAGPN